MKLMKKNSPASRKQIMKRKYKKPNMKLMKKSSPARWKILTS